MKKSLIVLAALAVLSGCGMNEKQHVPMKIKLVI